MKSSSKKIVTSIFWSFGERITAQLVTLVVTIILARILTPNEYGVIAVVTIFITLANVFVTSGFGNALIQKKNADNLDFSTTLYFSFTLSLIFYSLLFFAAEPIAAFYENESLVLVIRIMSLKLVFASINTIQQAYISKQMAFRKFFFSTIIGTLVSAIVGVVMAYCGFGVWALVAQYLTNSIIDTIVLSFTSGFRPSLSFSFERMKKIVPFGSKLLVSDLFSNLYSQLRGLLMSKFFSPADLSYYNQGDKYTSIFITNVGVSLNKVMFQSLSDSQDDLLEVKRLTRNSIKLSFFILCPIQLGLAATSVTWVPLLLTEKWIPCIPHIILLCVIYLFTPLIESHTRIIKSLGKGNALLVVMVVRYSLGIGMLLSSILFFNDPIILTAVGLPTQFLAWAFCSLFTRGYIGYNYKEQIADILPTAIAGVVMFACAYSIASIGLNLLVTLLLQIVIGVVVYFALTYMLDKKSFARALALTRGLKGKIKATRVF